MISTFCRVCEKSGPKRDRLDDAKQAARFAGWKYTRRRGWNCAACRYTRINRRFQWGIATPLAVAVAAMLSMIVIVIGETFGWWGA